MGRLIYEERDLTTASEEILRGVDKAVLAAAFRVRDKMRDQFESGSTLYKHSTPNYDHLSEGIMVGKLTNSQVKVHALGSRENYDTFKTRFFVGGTQYREHTGNIRASGKPHTKGYIRKNEAVDKGLQEGQNILNNFISNVIDHG